MHLFVYLFDVEKMAHISLVTPFMRNQSESIKKLVVLIFENYSIRT